MAEVGLTARLAALADGDYRAFQAKLVPTVDPGKILGVRAPALRALAKETAGSAEALDFMAALPHRYYDEDNLHALYINAIRDYPRALRELRRFLPYVDNWATCDMLSPRSFRRRPEGLADEARRWISSGETYTARFGIGVLMKFYLDEGFEPEMPGWAAAACRGDYYVDMGAAWYFATAIAKRPEAAIPLLTERRLSVWVHNMTIRKAVESSRVSEETKARLRTLRIK